MSLQSTKIAMTTRSEVLTTADDAGTAQYARRRSRLILVQNAEVYMIGQRSSFFTALHVMQTRYCDENSVRPSVRPSVCLSHAWIVTKR